MKEKRITKCFMLKPSLNTFAEQYADENGFGKFSNLIEHLLVNLKKKK